MIKTRPETPENQRKAVHNIALNTSLKAPKGQWKEGVFQFPIRVYYEDTDMGGMVYHGRYVSYFERVRTESIQGTVLDVSRLRQYPESGAPEYHQAEKDGAGQIKVLTYVVSGLNIKYRRQASIGDLLIGHSMVVKVRAAAVEVHQWLTCGDDLIAEADVTIVLIDEKGHPVRWPKEAKALWTRVADQASKRNFAE